jgi:N6-adenosine-specific RNA methylase IME4
LRLDFQADVRQHSRKPDVFYERVAAASPGPRLDMFARERHEGFDSWGNEADLFESLAG